MRRLSIPLLTIVALALLAACTSGGAPSWTYAPAPSATAAASGAASGSPAASGAAGSVAPSSAASSTASGGASVAPSGGSGSAITIAAPVGAATGGFQPTSVEAPANADFQILFDNQDNQAPHNVELKDASGAAVQLGGDTQFFQGPGTRDYTVPALKAGTYEYFCVVHPTTMKGSLTVQ